MSAIRAVRRTLTAPGWRVVVLATVLALAIVSTPAAAQQPVADSLLQVGATVKFRTWATDAAAHRMSSALSGTVVARDGDDLRIRLARTGAVVTVAAGQLARLEVSGGRNRHTTEGALVGFGAGTLVGGLVGAAVAFGNEFKYACSGACASANRDRSMYVGAGVGALVGTIAGATVGHFLKTEQWSRIIPAPHAGLHLEPAPGGLALRLSASF